MLVLQRRFVDFRYRGWGVWRWCILLFGVCFGRLYIWRLLGLCTGSRSFFSSVGTQMGATHMWCDRCIFAWQWATSTSTPGHRMQVVDAYNSHGPRRAEPEAPMHHPQIREGSTARACARPRRSHRSCSCSSYQPRTDVPRALQNKQTAGQPVPGAHGKYLPTQVHKYIISKSRQPTRLGISPRHHQV